MCKFQIMLLKQHKYFNLFTFNKNSQCYIIYRKTDNNGI